MKKILNQLFEHQHLNKDQAREILINIANQQYNPSQVAAFITVFLMRSVSVEELKGFREALLELCVKVDFSEFNTIDLCGTGGDGKNTFNISTLSSFVVAGAGYKVAKHGNYGVSSVSGSSNVLEHLGFRFTNDENVLKKQLDKANIAFLHAPLFHPAMKSVAPIRKELGVKTFFNMLGPLVNPSLPQNQIVGVFDLKVMRLYHYIYQDLNRNYSIIHSLDGYDEISLTSPFKLIGNANEEIMEPESIGFTRLKQNEITGGESIEDAAQAFLNVLKNKATDAQINVVIANSAMAIQCIQPELTITDCIDKARTSIEEGKAFQSFNTLLSIN
jgi:anthranilate phosphoribosyltransferase